MKIGILLGKKDLSAFASNTYIEKQKNSKKGFSLTFSFDV
jgi:hypothetical protein